MKGAILPGVGAIAWEAQGSVAELVRIAHDQGFPPFAEVKDGKSEGLAVDILRAASAWAGVS